MKITHRLSSSLGRIQINHADSILSTGRMEVNVKPIMKQSAITLNNNAKELQPGVLSELKADTENLTVNIPSQNLGDCQSSHGGSEASFNT